MQPAVGAAHRVGVDRVCQVLVHTSILPPHALGVRVEALPAPRTGILTHINNRKLSRLAKLAGAPDDKAAGVELCARLGDTVTATEPLVVVHAEARGELAYALAYAQANADMFEIET